jgi:hypothetical protein
VKLEGETGEAQKSGNCNYITGYWCEAEKEIKREIWEIERKENKHITNILYI